MVSKDKEIRRADLKLNNRKNVSAVGRVNNDCNRFLKSIQYHDVLFSANRQFSLECLLSYTSILRLRESAAYLTAEAEGKV